MVTIVKKGLNDNRFPLKNGRVITIKGAGILNQIKEEDYNALMSEYSGFFAPRIISDKNPLGIFIVSKKASYAGDMSKEVGNEIKDNAAPVKVGGKKKNKK